MAVEQQSTFVVASYPPQTAKPGRTHWISSIGFTLASHAHAAIHSQDLAGDIGRLGG